MKKAGFRNHGVKKDDRVVFFTDAQHVQRDRGLVTGVVHQSWLGGYNGHEIRVRGKLHSVPFWRFAEVE